MGAFGDFFSGFSDPFVSYAKLGYGIYQDIRDFNYRRDLQDELFSREDNAVQRRKADLEAAGMNPFMAAGSPASAGSAVNISSKDIGSPGSVLDGLMAMQSYKKMKADTKKAEEDAKTAEFIKHITEFNSQNAMYDAMDRKDTFFFNRGYYRIPEEFSNGNVYFGDLNPHKSIRQDNPFYNQLQYQLDNNRNNADLLQRQADYFTSDKMGKYFGYVLDFLRMMNGR